MIVVILSHTVTKLFTDTDENDLFIIFYNHMYV